MRTSLGQKEQRPGHGKGLVSTVTGVTPDSVAEAAKLQKGDRIIRAAGVDIYSAGALIEVISRQAPGTWLPLLVEREGTQVELIAKFPPSREQESR